MGDKRRYDYMTSSPDIYPLLLAYARDNRKHPTLAEEQLWLYLRENQLGVKFRRQHIIADYIADFACVEKRLVIEVDGGYHKRTIQQIDDATRTLGLNRLGIRVVRFSNEEVLYDKERVLQKIRKSIEMQDNNKDSFPLGKVQDGAKAMIFAAGLGTRLKPLTDRMPKALVPVSGKPLLQILLEKLTKNGFDDIVINVHHFADMIEEWAAEYQSSFPLGKAGERAIAFSDERSGLLETGGGIKHAAPLLQDAERFLIHNVDILSNVDLPAFWQAGEGHEATLLVSERQTQRYLLFDDDLRLVGWTNIKTGEVRSPYPDLDPSAYRHLAFAGIHQMSSSMLPLMADYPDRFGIIDFYLDQCLHHDIRGYIQPSLRLMDVGKLDTLDQAEDFLKGV